MRAVKSAWNMLGTARMRCACALEHSTSSPHHICMCGSDWRSRELAAYFFDVWLEELLDHADVAIHSPRFNRGWEFPWWLFVELGLWNSDTSTQIMVATGWSNNCIIEHRLGVLWCWSTLHGRCRFSAVWNYGLNTYVNWLPFFLKKKESWIVGFVRCGC